MKGIREFGRKAAREPGRRNITAYQVEEAGKDRNRRSALQPGGGDFLGDRVGEREVRDDGEDGDEPAHQTRVRSSSLWHSMQVSTNGWLTRRGLRMSWPQCVQTP